MLQQQNFMYQMQMQQWQQMQNQPQPAWLDDQAYIQMRQQQDLAGELPDNIEEESPTGLKM